MNFLGEDFDSKECNRMCDNCKLGLKVVQRDVSPDASKIIQIIKNFESCGANITLKQLVDLLRGKKL